MSEFSFPFDVSVAGDRTVSAETFGTFLNAMVTNGVVKDADNALAVSESSPAAMSVDVATGRGFVGHTSKRRFYRNTASLTLTIEAADGSNPRDDLIVMEMKEAVGTRSVALAVVKGSAAGSPSDPSLTTTEATYQFAIARVRVGTGASSIANANITDLRATNGYSGLALAIGEISQLTTDTIATGDFIGFSDESESGDPSNKITVDNLMETGLPLVTEDTVAVASDYMLFLDGGATGNTNKESIAHFVALIAGTNLSESSGALNATNTTYSAGDGMDLSGTTFLLDLKSNAGLEITSTELSVAQGISQYDVAQFAASVVDNDFLRIDGTAVEGRSASEVLSDIGAGAVAGSSSIVTVGAVNAGSITSGFTSIDVGAGAISTTGAVGTGALNPAGDLAIADAKYIKLGGARMATAEPASDATGYGVVIGFDSAGSVAAGDAVYIDSAGKVARANAVVGSVTDPCIGIATNAGGSDGDDVYVLTHGIWRLDAEAFTAGDPVYLGESAGALTATIPATDGDYVQRVGIAVKDDVILVMPSIDVIEHA